MKNNHKFIYAIILFLISGSIFAESFRVTQIPNGSKFSCGNCHVSQLGGGARNQFGQLVESKYLNAQGNVVWNAELASLDADGDGATNGQELQDPNGVWRTGLTNPGTFSSVTNPGDKNSKPAQTSIAGLDMITTYSLSQNYPNPFNPSTTIKFSIPKSSFVNLEVYDTAGKLIAKLIDAEMPAGEHTALFDGASLSSGTYFYRIRANDFTSARKFILIK